MWSEYGMILHGCEMQAMKKQDRKSISVFYQELQGKQTSGLLIIKPVGAEC